MPLSGASAELGQTLQAAATLGGGPGVGIEIVDCGSAPETAVAAAKQAVASGAKMLVGPVFSAQASAVGNAVRVPVVTLSNNEELAGGGTFVFGVTTAQSAQAILSIAAQRNLRDVAVVVPPGTFGAQSAASAQRAGQALGLSVRPTLTRGSPDGLMAALSAGGKLPDAVYIPVADGTLLPFAEALRGSGIQLLGSTQWSALDLSQQPAFRDAWFAAPDPLRFAAFDEAFRNASGTPGGIISGLVLDGVELLRILGQTGQLSAKGLTRKEGFTGVIGPYRFDRSGQCERGLGVLRVGAGDFSLIGSTSV
ncbi:amino acid/amide ABC transporter substrate-binding protein (HAAT family) [Sulfitobacter guttiformis]|uniref:Amino acid/amide ABC transporter substrate-binding protein (HAAT family) n=1 Tax=Sulfitobacter guttiformis TaxID=74349 RepID=A0A420DT80_9RHOB|nr:amino acid/amide ABC transporter substrate-binding protein (HAAT family) [Sulfitobacter guttiformis]